MRNDDPEYVRDLERSVRSMELEIKTLEAELVESRRLNDELSSKLNPAYMGEPTIQLNKPTFEEFWARVESAESGVKK